MQKEKKNIEAHKNASWVFYFDLKSLSTLVLREKQIFPFCLGASVKVCSTVLQQFSVWSSERLITEFVAWFDHYLPLQQRDDH